MTFQQRISLARNQAQVGRTLDVLVEGTGELSDRSSAERSVVGNQPAEAEKTLQGLRSSPARRRPVALTRSYRDAPEVDGLVIVPGALPIGTMARVKIIGAMEYDLMGECEA